MTVSVFDIEEAVQIGSRHLPQREVHHIGIVPGQKRRSAELGSPVTVLGFRCHHPIHRRALRVHQARHNAIRRGRGFRGQHAF